MLSAIFSPDGASVRTVSWDQTAKIWSSPAGECRSALYGHEDLVYFAVFSPDGGSVLTASRDQTAKIWSSVRGDLAALIVGRLMMVCHSCKWYIVLCLFLTW